MSDEELRRIVAECRIKAESAAEVSLRALRMAQRTRDSVAAALRTFRTRVAALERLFHALVRDRPVK